MAQGGLRVGDLLNRRLGSLTTHPYFDGVASVSSCLLSGGVVQSAASSAKSWGARKDPMLIQIIESDCLGPRIVDPTNEGKHPGSQAATTSKMFPLPPSRSDT